MSQIFGYYGWFDPDHWAKHRGQKHKKKRAEPVGHLKPFKNSLKWLSHQPADKWLMKEVTIRYFRIVQFDFTGQISCVSSNGQLRLQYIEFPEYDITETFALSDYINVHHSFWFHYKDIAKVTFEDKDVTNEILDILQMRIAEAFIFYYDYELLHRSNISKIICGDFSEQYLRQLIDLDFDYAEFSKHRLDYLFDINRQNKYLILKKNTYFNEQRRFLRWSESEMSRIINNLKDLFIKQMEHVIKCKRKRSEAKEKQLETECEHEEDDADDEKKDWPTYLDWDEAEVDDLVKKELQRTENTMAMIVFEGGTTKVIKRRLFDLSMWGKPVPRRYIQGIAGPHRTSHRNKRRLKNKFESLRVKKKKMSKKKRNQRFMKTLKNNKLDHITQHQRLKRKLKKQKRQDWRLVVTSQYHSC